MKKLTAKEFHKELEKSGTTIRDLLIDNLDYVQCELDDGSYLGYSVFIVYEFCGKVEGADGGNEVSHHVSEGGLLEFYLSGGICDRAVVEGYIMIENDRREFRFILDWDLTMELDGYVLENLGYGGLVY